jgi:hypothetical protein
MSLAEIIKQYPDKKYRHVSFPEGRWVRVLASIGNRFWTQNNEGTDVILAGDSVEKGWVVCVETRKEKWCGWFHRQPLEGIPNEVGHAQFYYKRSDWVPTDVSEWFRLEQFDFEILIHE